MVQLHYFVCIHVHFSLKILQSVHLENYYQDVWEKTINLVIPSYINTGASGSLEGLSSNTTSIMAHANIEKYLKEVLINTIKAGNKDDVSRFNEGLSGIKFIFPLFLY